jgi:cytochrome c oxidase subunit 2
MEHLLNLPPDGAAHGAGIDHLIGLVHWLMAALFVGWGTFYVVTLIRFRSSRNPKANYHGVKGHASNYLEAAVLVVEVILLAGFSIPMWSERVDAFPAERDATVVHIVAEQFAWNVHYPGPDGKFGRRSLDLVDAENPLGLDRTDADARDDITTINQLTLPVGKPVIIYLTSKDVIHSLNLPPYRVKQDAVPGLNIPVWFTPTKTTDQIRDELRHPFSVTGAVSKLHRITLPKRKTLSVKDGDDYKNFIVLEDCVNASGETALAKGEHLTADNVHLVAEAGVKQVVVRSGENFDKYIAVAEYKDADGNTIIAANDPLIEDAVNRLVEAGVAEVTARKASYLDPFVAMENYTDKNGTAIVAKGDYLSEEILSHLAEAGIHEIVVAPATPTEIACAQLCGLGHYRMRGYVTVETQEKFDAWMKEQEESLPQATAGDHASEQFGSH